MVVSAERIAPAGRLVLVAQTYFPAIDGTAALIQHLAEQFAADGNDVHVVTTDALGPAGFRTRRVERTTTAPIEDINGVRVHRLSTRWWLSSMSRFVQAIGRRLRFPGAERIGNMYLGPMMCGFPDILDQLAPTAVYASSFPYLHMHQLVAWGESRRVPVVLHGAIHPEDRWAFDRSSIRRSCVRAAGYAANTAYEARHVESMGVPSDSITVVGVGVDSKLLETARATSRGGAPGEGDGKPRILYLGQLARRKGLDTLVAALPTIWARHPGAEIVIAGKTTEDAHDLRSAALQVSQGRDLRWLPDITEAQKAALLASASMVLFPSRAESFGIVFLEAWSFGLPVVGCRAGAIPDVVEDEVTGLLMSPGDSLELANCVTRLIDDPNEAKRMGAEGQRRVRGAHTWSAVAKRARQALDRARNRIADQSMTRAPNQNGGTATRVVADCHGNKPGTCAPVVETDVVTYGH